MCIVINLYNYIICIHLTNNLTQQLPISKWVNTNISLQTLLFAKKSKISVFLERISSLFKVKCILTMVI